MRVCNLDTCPVGVATQNPICGKDLQVSQNMLKTLCDL